MRKETATTAWVTMVLCSACSNSQDQAHPVISGSAGAGTQEHTARFAGGQPSTNGGGSALAGSAGVTTGAVAAGNLAVAGAAAVADVTSLSALAGDGEVTLVWASDAAETDTGQLTTQISIVGMQPTLIVPAGTHRWTVSGLSNRTEYTFIVRRLQASGAASPGVAIGARADYVRVEGGTFRQGSDDATLTNSYPAHQVKLSSFFIGKYEITFAEYDEFAEASGAQKPTDRGWGRSSRPVLNVSWFDTVAYANWRSAKEGLESVYVIDRNTPDPLNVTGDAVNYTVTANWYANGYRLPTEAEWEFAAIGGTKSAGFKFAGSDQITDVAWSGADAAAGINGTAVSHPVGTKKANELGLFDLTGNVVEWVWDAALNAKRANYSAEPQIDPRGSAGNYDRRIVRGGGAMAGASCSYNFARHYLSPTRNCMLGFRLARSVKEVTP